MTIKNFFKKIVSNHFEKKRQMIGLSHFINLRNKYNLIKKFNELDYKIFSQNGEDGLIDYVLYRLNISKPVFVEIGVGDYLESNTIFLYNTRSLKGLIVDCLPNLENKISKNVKKWKGELFIEEAFVDENNILNILKKNHFETSDLFSLDIDGNDYWILKELPNNFSKIAIIEYNSIFGPNLEVTVPNIKNFTRENYHYSNLCYGMSLKAAITLMDKKNFYFLGTNLIKNNAFFVSKNFPKNIFFPNLQIDNIIDSTYCFLSESRDKNGNLNFLKGKNKVKEILECGVVDLSKSTFPIVKLKDLL